MKFHQVLIAALCLIMVTVLLQEADNNGYDRCKRECNAGMIETEITYTTDENTDWMQRDPTVYLMPPGIYCDADNTDCPLLAVATPFKNGWKFILEGTYGLDGNTLTINQ